MKRYAYVVVLTVGSMVLGAVNRPAIAQEAIDIVGTIRFYSPDITQAQPLRYGVGTAYTNSTDKGKETLIPPFPPPGNSYLVYLDRDCGPEDGDPPCWWKSDLRGVPDSVETGDAKQFQLRYRIGIENNTGKTLFLSILNPDWPDGVDSIHVVDAQLARAFDHTFTGPVEAEVEDVLTRYLDVTVFYNLVTSSVQENQIVDGQRSLDVAPNPAATDVLTVSGEFRRGDRIQLATMLGEVVLTRTIGEDREQISFSSGDLASGNYVVVQRNERGSIVAREKVNVIR